MAELEIDMDMLFEMGCCTNPGDVERISEAKKETKGDRVLSCSGWKRAIHSLKWLMQPSRYYGLREWRECVVDICCKRRC